MKKRDRHREPFRGFLQNDTTESEGLSKERSEDRINQQAAEDGRQLQAKEQGCPSPGGSGVGPSWSVQASDGTTRDIGSEGGAAQPVCPLPDDGDQLLLVLSPSALVVRPPDHPPPHE
ncbi:uncharacterized [Tachysurus ichikawai]